MLFEPVGFGFDMCCCVLRYVCSLPAVGGIRMAGDARLRVFFATSPSDGFIRPCSLIVYRARGLQVLKTIYCMCTVLPALLILSKWYPVGVPEAECEAAIFGFFGGEG